MRAAPSMNMLGSVTTRSRSSTVRSKKCHDSRHCCRPVRPNERTHSSNSHQARAESARLETVVAQQVTEQVAAQARADELAEQLEGARATLDAMAAHAEELELELAARRGDDPVARSARSRPTEIVAQGRADADELRRQAMREAETIRRDALTTAEGIRHIAQEDARELAPAVGRGRRRRLRTAPSSISGLLERVAKLELRLAKQRKRIERAADRIERTERAEYAGMDADEILDGAEKKAARQRESAEKYALEQRGDADEYASEPRAKATEQAAELRAAAERDAAATARGRAARGRRSAREPLGATRARILEERRDAAPAVASRRRSARAEREAAEIRDKARARAPARPRRARGACSNGSPARRMPIRTTTDQAGYGLGPTEVLVPDRVDRTRPTRSATSSRAAPPVAGAAPSRTRAGAGPPCGRCTTGTRRRRSPRCADRRASGAARDRGSRPRCRSTGSDGRRGRRPPGATAAPWRGRAPGRSGRAG